MTEPPAAPPPPTTPPPRETPPPRPRREIPWKPILWAAAVLAVLLAVGWQRCGISGCPDVDRLGAFQPDGAPVVVDRDGETIGELKLAQHRIVRLDELPDYVGEAFLAVEDRRFYDHDGVDWRRVGGALLANLRAGGVEEGSSTLTMQLARNVFPERLPGQERTLRRKILEVRVAREIEDEFSKDEILELYLNHIYFGAGRRGIEAASLYYFGKPASEVSLKQAAMLAALPKAPTRYNPRRNYDLAKARRDLVITLMEEQGRITAEEAAEVRGTTLGVSRRPADADEEASFAPWFLEKVQQAVEERFGDSLYRQPVRLVTTLDRDAQRAAEEELSRQLRTIEGGAFGRFRGPRYSSGAEIAEGATPYLQGAVVMMEAQTGDILAWVGGRDFGHSRFDRAERARRQIGSTVKPFVFAQAIAAGHPPSELISDQPLEVRLSSREVWKPSNFEDRYEPQVTLREALVRSKNVATVRLASSLGFGQSLQLARDAGLATRISNAPSGVLGSFVASPLQATTAFTALASLGEVATPQVLLRIEEADGEVLWEARPSTHRVLDPAVAYVVTDMLQEAVQRGTGSAVRAAGFRGPAAGKTGTTNEQQDVWFVGYTPDVVATVWMGFDRPREIVPRASGGRLAAPVWGRMMRRVYRDRAMPAGWELPPGVLEGAVSPSTGRVYLARCGPVPGDAQREVFLRGTVSACPGGGLGSGWTRLRDMFGFWDDEPPPPPPPPPPEIPDYLEEPDPLDIEPYELDLRVPIEEDEILRVEGEGDDVRLERVPADPPPQVGVEPPPEGEPPAGPPPAEPPPPGEPPPAEDRPPPIPDQLEPVERPEVEFEPPPGEDDEDDGADPDAAPRLARISHHGSSRGRANGRGCEARDGRATQA